MKNKNRCNKFNEIDTSPQLVLTRWGTWLNAAEYYAKNLAPNVAKLLAEIHCDYQVLPKDYLED